MAHHLLRRAASVAPIISIIAGCASPRPPTGEHVKQATAAEVKPAQPAKSPYPPYANGVELLTLPDPDNRGTSELLRAMVFTTFGSDPLVGAATSNAMKARAAAYQILRSGKKLSDTELRRSVVAETCADRVTARAAGSNDENFVWDEDLWQKAFPSEVLATNANLKAALEDYSRLNALYGTQFEARKKKLKKLPTTLSAACADAGVLRAASSAMAPSTGPAGGFKIPKYTKAELVAKNGQPTDLGIAQAYQEYAWKNLVALGRPDLRTNDISAGKNLGCVKSGTSFKCDWSAMVRRAAGDRQEVGNNRFIWTTDRWAMIDN